MADRNRLEGKSYLLKQLSLGIDFNFQFVVASIVCLFVRTATELLTVPLQPINRSSD